MRNAASGQPRFVITQTLYERLRSCARAFCKRESPSPSLEATVLVNDALVAILRSPDELTRSFLVARAVRKMKWLLLDRNRRHWRQRRGGGPIGIDRDRDEGDACNFAGSLSEHTGRVLAELARLNQRHYLLVLLRFAYGMPADQVAAAMNVSPPTMWREWRAARAWLAHRLAQEDSEQER